MRTTTPLAVPAFRRLYLAQIFTLLGTGFTTVALALLAHDLAGGRAGVVLGVALAVKMLASITVAPLAANLADRWPIDRTLGALTLARGLLVCSLAFVTAEWQIYLAMFLLNACAAAYTPLFQASIPGILPDEAAYTRALSLSRLAYDLENLLSPVLAAAALTWLSFHALFYANAVLFAVAAALIFTAGVSGAASPSSGGWLFGLRAYLQTPRLRALLALSLSVAAGSAMLIVNTVVYVQERLGSGPEETALAFAFAGGGSMLVALVLPRWLMRAGDRIPVLSGGLLLTGALLIGSQSLTLAELYALWFVLGAGTSLVQTPAGRIIQRSCQPADRGAYFAAHFALSHLCWLLCYPLAGFLGARGLEQSFAVMAALAGGGALLGAAFWGSDAGELLHRHAGLRHTHAHSHHDHHHDHHHTHGPDHPANTDGVHTHEHEHPELEHSHHFTIDAHHLRWPH